MTISNMLPTHATNNMYGGSTTKIMGHCIEANPLVFHDTSFYMPKVMYCQMRFLFLFLFFSLKCQCQTFHFVFAQLEREWTAKLHDTYINVLIGNDKELAMLTSSFGVFPTMDACINLSKNFHTLGGNPNLPMLTNLIVLTMNSRRLLVNTNCVLCLIISTFM